MHSGDWGANFCVNLFLFISFGGGRGWVEGLVSVLHISCIFHRSYFKFEADDFLPGCEVFLIPGLGETFSNHPPFPYYVNIFESNFVELVESQSPATRTLLFAILSLLDFAKLHPLRASG